MNYLLKNIGCYCAGHMYFIFQMVILLFITSGHGNVCAQSVDPIPVITKLDLESIPKHKLTKSWFKVGVDAFSHPVLVPLLILRGTSDTPILGMTAAIHGNELNGIPIIQRIFNQIDPSTLKGTLIGIPGINPESMQMNERRFTDGEDLNRVFPGKNDGSESEQRAHTLLHDLIGHMI